MYESGVGGVGWEVGVGGWLEGDYERGFLWRP